MTGPARGEVWDVDFDPVRGREQAGRRPALIVSVDPFNQGPAELIIVLPITRTDRHIRWHVPVQPPEGGLTSQSFIMCENARSISKLRLAKKRGRVSSSTALEVEDRLRILLGF
ncbi:MAG: type II toxin-antitoxin system PemK/MazF family toxin [Acidobacteriota bacterium]